MPTNSLSPLLHTYALTASADFLPAALDEVRRLDPTLHQIMEPSSEVAVVESALDMGAMHEGLQRQPPIFLRHIAPAHCRVILSGEGQRDLGDLARETIALPGIRALQAGDTFSVQARLFSEDADRSYSPFAIKSAIVPLVELETGATEDVKAPQVVISVLVMPVVGLVGISPVEFNLSGWSGGARRFARESGQLSRAEFKLLEALELFGVRLPPDGAALDLGAAPGGWTRVLRQAGLKVMAVDTAEVDGTLKQDEGVKVVRGPAQECIERLKQAGAKFDLLTCDIRMDARDAARLMVEAAPLLRLNSVVILTLGLPSVEAVGMDPIAITHQALDELRSRYRTVRARQLFHNRNEVTVCLTL